MPDPMCPEELTRTRAYIEHCEAQGPSSVGNLSLLRRLLDENARLNAELDEWRRVGGQANQGLKDATAELEARNNEITRMGREIVKANEAFAAIWAEINTWDLTDEQIDERLENVGGVPRVEGWIKLAVKRGNAKALKAILEPAPEMPRPPAEEAPTEYRCPNCYRWALWTDGVVDGDDEGVEEFWCQTCGSQTPVENMDSRPQERAGDTDTSPAGSGRGTGVAEDENPAQECDHWFTDVAEAVRPAHYRQAAGELLALVAHFEHIGSERTEWMAGLRDGAEHLARSTSDAAPSLPVPSTGE